MLKVSVKRCEGAFCRCASLIKWMIFCSALSVTGRNAPASDLRTALCAGLLLALTVLALLGLFELKAGRVGRGMLVSVVVEALLAAGFASVLLA